MPGNVFLPAASSGLPKDAVVNVTALVTLDKSDLDTEADRAKQTNKLFASTRFLPSGRRRLGRPTDRIWRPKGQDARAIFGHSRASLLSTRKDAVAASRVGI